MKKKIALLKCHTQLGKAVAILRFVYVPMPCKLVIQLLLKSSVRRCGKEAKPRVDLNLLCDRLRDVRSLHGAGSTRVILRKEGVMSFRGGIPSQVVLFILISCV